MVERAGSPGITSTLNPQPEPRNVQPILIESLDDERVADYRDVRDADLVGRRGLFIAEGELVVRILLRLHAKGAGYRAMSVLLNRTRYDSLCDALEPLDPGCPVYVCEQQVMDGVVGFHIHRGVLAAGARTSPRDPVAVIEAGSAPPGPVVVMEDIANHDNVGGVFRSAAAFGCHGVLLTRRCCDPLYRKSIRVSMGHALTTPWSYVESVEHACELLHARGWTTVALTPAPDAEDIAQAASALGDSNNLAILLGAEGPGLTEHAQRIAKRRVRIPMAESVDSLNVGVACAVALHALR